MKEYKRLTNNNRDEYDPEYDFCCDCKYFGEPCGCNRPNGTCGNYDRFLETYSRLAELENKIENGTLVELPCKVGDVVYAFVFEIEPHIEQYSVIAIEIGIETFIRCFEAKRGLCYLRPTSIFLTKAEAEEKLKELQEGKYK